MGSLTWDYNISMGDLTWGSMGDLTWGSMGGFNMGGSI